MDSVMFDAFNRRDLDTLKTVFAENVEFYNDSGGLSDYRTTVEIFRTMFNRNATNGLRRELVKERLEVYPIPNFGAIEVGTMKFVQVWQLKDGKIEGHSGHQPWTLTTGGWSCGVVMCDLALARAWRQTGWHHHFDIVAVTLPIVEDQATILAHEEMPRLPARPSSQRTPF